MYKKKIEISFSFFKKVFGCGSLSQKEFFNYYGINVRLRSVKLKQEFFNKIRILIDELTFRRTLKMKLITTRKFIIEKIKNYTSLRYTLRYPIRGQRTHTNGKTRKNLKTKVPLLT